MGAWALAVGAGLYVAVLWAASLSPGPRNWGVHLLGFLPIVARQALLSFMGALVAALALTARLTSARPAATAAPSPIPAARKGTKQRSRRSGEASRKSSSSGRLGSVLWLLALPLYGALLYLLRTRTHFLGDGGVWLNMLLGGDIDPFSEPLSAAVWRAFRDGARAMGWPMSLQTFALLPVICGVVAAAFAWGLLAEAMPSASRGQRWIAWALILTTGITQIYYGYLESYPIASVAAFAYLWLALRHARGADPPWLLGVALAVALGFHLVLVVLLPSYAVAVARRPGAPLLKAALLLIPIGLAPLVLTAAGLRPEAWLRPFETVARTAADTSGAATLTRPYPLLSLDHARDITNALLLAAPVPLLLGLAWALDRRGRIRPSRPSSEVLAAAALAGLVAVLVLVLPVAPAQDWDLTSVLILPFAIAAVVAGRTLLAEPARGRALAAFGAASLLAFVGVNASERASIARFKVLLAPDAPLSRYGRGYGHSMLSEFYEDRGQLDSALAYADLAIRSEPTNPRYWLREGTILYDQKRYDEAIPRLEESIRRGTSRVAAHFNLGLAYARTRRIPEAAVQFRTAMAMDPSNPAYPHHLALMLYDSGYPDSARTMWEGVLERWPGYALTARAMAKRFPAPPR